ncbi:Glucan endo-1,3-beta-glucosidase-like protein [Drosera capensis]
MRQLGAGEIGIDYGLLGDNLPPPEKVICLIKAMNFKKVRIYDPNLNVLSALGGSGLQVMVGVRNEDIQAIALSPGLATRWVKDLIQNAHDVEFSCISVGNEIIPGDLATFVLPAMQNIDLALKSANLKVPVSTVVSMAVLGTSYPPSSASFESSISSSMVDIVNFLSTNGYPFLVNVYPYFAYASDPVNIPLDYAIFGSNSSAVMDGTLSYQNLFDAMVDSVYYALDRASAQNVKIIVAETGWPSAGNGDKTTITNAMTYNQNLLKRVLFGKGTPKMPGVEVEAYIFAMFNEDLKPEGVEQNWGLFYPNLTEVYHLDLFDENAENPRACGARRSSSTKLSYSFLTMLMCIVVAAFPSTRS